MTSSVDVIRDNLNVGLYLSHGRFGATLEDILQAALGFDPNRGQLREDFVRRFRSAQVVGRDAFKDRVPGYFTFNAMPFGGEYIYKATWYVWVNPQTSQPQTVPLLAGDLASMRRLRDRDLNTREGTTRNIRTAHNIEEERQAIQRQDWSSLREIQSRMTEDGSIGEILSGYHGLPYAEVQEIIPQLPNRAQLFHFQRQAQHIQQLSRRLEQEQAALNQQLTAWVMLQTGVPSNAPQWALQQAQDRLSNL